MTHGAVCHLACRARAKRARVGSQAGICTPLFHAVVNPLVIVLATLATVSLLTGDLRAAVVMILMLLLPPRTSSSSKAR